MGFPTLKEREKFAKLLKDFSWTDDLFAELDGKEPKEAMELWQSTSASNFESVTVWVSSLMMRR